jgi:hypothetical protein
MSREHQRLDVHLASFLPESSRLHLWALASDTLKAAKEVPPGEPCTGLVLGYVQSGKTTAMTALMATAADEGYNIIIAILGGTNILLAQNAKRITTYLGIETRTDYAWVSIQNPKGDRASKEITEWLTKGRALFIPVLKNRSRLDDLAAALRGVSDKHGMRVLIVDDEADQASLNTEVRKGTESRVYQAIDSLREAIPTHTFIQFTATPYAPLLLEVSDPLFPRFVKFLQPGPGYTGGREFFVDHKDSVVRYIPASDEQSSAKLPVELPGSLTHALWSFVIGSAVMLQTIPDSPPISMLVHSSHRNDVQERYHFLIARAIREMARQGLEATSISGLPSSAAHEYDRLQRLGVTTVPTAALLERTRYVLRELKTWLLNSATAIKQVDWNVSPIHILVGGNKLDRGFTIEGLTITYMNRPASDQVDTIEQRARAFGYRSEFLPFCQFFGTARTVKMLREIVYTEYDLRANMQDYMAAGRAINEWVTEIGLLVPGGSKPTRDAVVREMSRTVFGWHQLRRPSLAPEDIDANWALCSDLGLLDAPLRDYGRLSFRTMTIKSNDVAEFLLAQWHVHSYSPGWRSEDLLQSFRRSAVMQPQIDVLLMEQNAGTAEARPRQRSWTEQEGFINLFQGRDVNPTPGKPYYPGDRLIGGIDVEPERILLQVHRTIRQGAADDERLLTLALHLGDRQLIKGSDNAHK